MEEKETRKVVTATIRFVFEGDYIPTEDVIQYLDGWIDSGLDDRDNLVGWTTSYSEVMEIPIED